MEEETFELVSHPEELKKGTSSTPWGKPMALSPTEEPSSNKATLQSIMDEELAQKLQDEIDRESYVIPSPVSSSSSDDDSESLLSQKNTNPTSFDEDLAMAMQLQAEEASLYEKNRKKCHSSNGHVRVQYQDDPNYKILLAQEESERQAQFCNEQATNDDHQEVSSGLPRTAWKVENGEYITKHDLERSSQKHVAELEGKFDLLFDKTTSTMSNKVYNDLKTRVKRSSEASTVKGVSSRGRVEAATFATSEAVLDEKTRLVLLKLMNRGDLDAIHGVIRTGKEANVYNGVNAADGEIAVKIFKTTLTAFRNRSEYVVGDHRFDQDYSSKSLSKQTSDWTSKEFANLCRANKAGVTTPVPKVFKDNVLLMSFIGKDSWPAPQLREAAPSLTLSQAYKAYTSIVKGTRVLYQQAKLVHADLSPYNLLYFKKTVYWIDFGQAVEVLHPMAMEYLERDIDNITKFFTKTFPLKASESTNKYLSREQYKEFVTKTDVMTDQQIKAFLQKT